MKHFDFSLEKIELKNEIPFDLLLLADETIEAIEKYIYDSQIYILKEKEKTESVAVFALYKISDNEIEIKNIAVAEKFQNEGIGSSLIEEIKRIALENKFKTIIVGTPDSALRQIRFYEKNGFRKFAVKKDFFLDNYSSPIIEDGVMLRDMVMLRINL